DMAGCILLTGDVCSPENDHSLVFSHILLGVDLECARQAPAQAAEAPADHCPGPILAAGKIGETVDHPNRDRATWRKAAVSRPQTHGLGSDCRHALHYEVQRLVPTHAAPGIRAAIIANLGVQMLWGERR